MHDLINEFKHLFKSKKFSMTTYYEPAYTEVRT